MRRFYAMGQTRSGWMNRPEGSLGWKKVLLAGMDSPAWEIFESGVVDSTGALPVRTQWLFPHVLGTVTP